MRLQYAVATHYKAPSRIEPRLVLRVRRNANQLPQAARRQLGVTVKCHDVFHVCSQARAHAKIQKRIAGADGQSGYQLLQLAAFALPSNPALFAGAERAVAVQ